MAEDEDALICDFAETYHIYDYKALPVGLAATLAAGLGIDSRIKSKMAGLKAPMSVVLLASAVDNLAFLRWSKTKDAEQGRNAPKQIANTFIIGSDDNKPVVYSSPEEFEMARQAIIERSKRKNGN